MEVELRDVDTHVLGSTLSDDLGRKVRQARLKRWQGDLSRIGLGLKGEGAEHADPHLLSSGRIENRADVAAKLCCLHGILSEHDNVVEAGTGLHLEPLAVVP